MKPKSSNQVNKYLGYNYNYECKILAKATNYIIYMVYFYP